MIASLWHELRKSETGSTPDHFHAIVFGELDILKYGALLGTTFKQLPKYAVASYAMTHAMGESLYIGLASLDASICGPIENRGWFKRHAQKLQKDLRRIEKVYLEVYENTPTTSVSVETLKGLLDLPAEMTDKIISQPPIAKIVFKEQGYALQLSPWAVHDLSPHEQILRAFHALNHGPLSKEDFFASVWGNAKYASRLHDKSIWYVLSRIKKLTGISCPVRDGMIHIEDGVWIV